jgi:hypothetical protein
VDGCWAGLGRPGLRRLAFGQATHPLVLPAACLLLLLARSIPSPLSLPACGDVVPGERQVRRRIPIRIRQIRGTPLCFLNSVLLQFSTATGLDPILSRQAKGKSSTAASSSRATKRSTASGGKAEKKVYSLLGQKFDPPEETEPVRIFYDSLSKQIPSSEMAEFWYSPSLSDSTSSFSSVADIQMSNQSRQNSQTTGRY